MKEQYKIEDLKRILKEIVIEEEKEHNINIEGYLLTISEYYKSSILKDKLKLFPQKESILYLTAPLKFGGWYDIKDKRIIILINSLYEKFDILSPDSFFHIIRKIYHEIRHVYQNEKMNNTNKYQEFYTFLEKILIKHDSLYYRLKHDFFLTEIDADTYSIEKTEKYLKEKNNGYYEENINDIDSFKRYLSHRNNIYNEEEIFEKFNFILQGKIKKNKKFSNEPLNKTIKELEYSSYNIKDTLAIFYNQDGSFKTIKEIINNQNKVDNKIINTIITSISFIKSININNLGNEEIKYLIQALENKYQKELSKLETIKKINEEDLTFIEESIYNEKKQMKKLKNILSLRSILMNILLNNKMNNSDISLYEYIKKRKSK